jgi:hypothetical protein
MIPTDSVLAAIAARHPLGGLGQSRSEPAKQNSHPQKRAPFPAWSAIDDAKLKADALAKEAAREYEVASKTAQSKTGKIEPWTAKYYAACIFGGMMACVCRDIYSGWDTHSQQTIGPYSHCRHPSRFDQMPSPGRSWSIQEQYAGVHHDSLCRGSSWSIYRLGPHFLWLQRKSTAQTNVNIH